MQRAYSVNSDRSSQAYDVHVPSLYTTQNIWNSSDRAGLGVNFHPCSDCLAMVRARVKVDLSEPLKIPCSPLTNTTRFSAKSFH